MVLDRDAVASGDTRHQSVQSDSTRRAGSAVQRRAMPVVKGPTESSAVRFYPHERIAAAPVAKRNATSKDGMRRKRAARPEDLHFKANASLSDGMAFTFLNCLDRIFSRLYFPFHFLVPEALSQAPSKFGFE